MPRTARTAFSTARLRRLTVVGALIVVAALSGCAGSTPGSTPAIADAKADALAIRDAIEATMPEGASIGTSDVDNQIGCDADTAQYDGTRTITVAPGFDSAQWLDAVAAEYGGKSRWRAEKKVAADGSSDATSGLALFSTDGFYVRIDAIADAPSLGPVVMLSASSPCALL